MSEKSKYVISILLKALINFCAVAGVLLSAIGTDAFMTGSGVLLFFTIQSNIWIALCCLAGLTLMQRGVEYRPWMYKVKLVFTVAISLTGFVFCIMLAPTLKNPWTPANILTHVVVPLAAIADFFVVCSNYEFKMSDACWTFIPPVYYVIFAAVGYVRGWNFGNGSNYPYFFLNWGSPAGAFGFCKELPFMGVVWWLVVLCVFLFGVSNLYFWLFTLPGKIRKKLDEKQ